MKTGKDTKGAGEKRDFVNHKYSCALCPYASKLSSSYKKHLKVHLSEKRFKCPECPYRAKVEGNVRAHVKHVHLLGSGSRHARPFPCPHPGCSYAGKQKSTLQTHSKIHSDEKSFSCSHPNCNFSTKYQNSLTDHLRIHSGEKPFVCQFESCSYAAVQLNHLQVHSRVHTKEKPYKCPEPNCEYATAHYSHFKKHRLTHSPEEGKIPASFQCLLCEYTGKSKTHLASHIEKHTLEKPLKCDHPNCTFAAKRKHEVEQHKVVHSDEKPFACPLESCEYSCKLKTNLSVHLKRHSEERRYKCSLCPFRGKTRDGVLKHSEQMHSDPSFRPFKCPELECDFASKQKGNLQNHVLIHKGDKKYECSFPLCSFKAVVAAEVKRHQRHVHEREKRLKCELCNYATNANGSLVVHMRIHTKEKPYSCKEKTNGCEYRAKHLASLRTHEKKHAE